MSEPNDTSSSGQSEELLQRMRDGDREAAAEFITLYDSRIRSRIRGRLNPAMRRLFDSQDIISSVGKKLDQYVSAGNLEVENERQLWALVIRMAMNAVIDKSRLYRRLQQAEGPDSMVAQEILRRLRYADQKSNTGFEIELEFALNMFSDKIDREILFQWLNGFRLNEIARSIDMAPTGVRKRWQMIRERLQERFSSNTQEEAAIDADLADYVSRDLEIQDEMESDKAELSVSLEVTEDLSAEELEDLIVKYARAADAYHRSMGGHGLEIERLEIETGVMSEVST